MPNWCMNNLYISHSNTDKLQEFVDAYNSGNTCEHYLPVPKNEDGTVFHNWYSFCCNNWGTKWDFGKGDYSDPAMIDSDNVVVSFNTAWSPPIQFYEKLVELGYNVRGTYWEPDMAFCGIWDNGIDNYVEYGDMDNKEDIIPVALWNEYAMDDFFEEMA
jgi:hypothetical protein